MTLPIITPSAIDRVASGFELLATNPDVWLRQAVINDIAQAFREMAVFGVGAKIKTMEFTTETMAIGGEVSGSVNIAKAFIIHRVVADQPCRIRLYSTNDFRINDSGRPIGTDPTGEFGLLLELVLIPSFLDFSLSPPAVCYNGDNPISSATYFAVQNMGAGGPINISVDYTELVL